jgi:hypothetical protein
LIDHLDWYYVCEYPVLSVLWGRKALGIPDLAFDRTNVTQTGSDLSLDPSGTSETALSTLMASNPRDMAIYAHALARFFRVVADLACDLNEKTARRAITDAA